jgi:hypothetical protein
VIKLWVIKLGHLDHLQKERKVRLQNIFFGYNVTGCVNGQQMGLPRANELRTTSQMQFESLFQSTIEVIYLPISICCLKGPMH